MCDRFSIALLGFQKEKPMSQIMSFVSNFAFYEGWYYFLNKNLCVRAMASSLFIFAIEYILDPYK